MISGIRFQTLLVIIIILALGLWGRHIYLQNGISELPESESPRAEQTRTAESLVNPAEESKITHRGSQVLHSRLPKSDSRHSRYESVPRDSVVEFKTIDGIAVAYGDTVIGKVGPAFDAPAGLTESPPVQIWKSNEIPYAVDNAVKDKSGINQALELIQSRTNVRFIPYANQDDAIVFTLGKENCMSALGRTGGMQPIYLEPRCGKIEIAHEIMHALGFVHEQSRTDRDRYVTILWQNIQEPFQAQFAIVPETLMGAYGDTPFDPSSIMMYDPHVFATNPQVETMKLINGAQIQNNPDGLSDMDVFRVNRLYRN